MSGDPKDMLVVEDGAGSGRWFVICLAGCIGGDGGAASDLCEPGPKSRANRAATEHAAEHQREQDAQDARLAQIADFQQGRTSTCPTCGSHSARITPITR